MEDSQLTIKIPAGAYDIRIGNDMMTQGLLYKTPCHTTAITPGGWAGHFKSFGSAGQSPVAMIAKRFERNGNFITIYA